MASHPPGLHLNLICDLLFTVADEAVFDQFGTSETNLLSFGTIALANIFRWNIFSEYVPVEHIREPEQIRNDTGSPRGGWVWERDMSSIRDLARNYDDHFQSTLVTGWSSIAHAP